MSEGHDQSAEKAIKTIAHVIRLLVNKDYEIIANESVSKELSAELIEFGVSAYPGRLVFPPDSAFNPERLFGNDQILFLGDPDNPDGFVCSVDFPLWVADEEQESDLVLMLEFYESETELYNYAFCDLDVP